MDKLEKAKRLKGMLSQIAGRQGLESIASASAKASGGLESISPERTNVQSGLEKLADNRHQDITPNEMFGLEAIVMKENRPVVFVRGNSYDDVGNPWSSLNAAEVKTRLSDLFPLIGRIELPNSTLLPYAGTGFVVGKGLVATNRHVAQIFAQGLGLTIRYRGGDAAIDFKREVDTPEDDRSDYLSVRGVEMIHPYWDMALLQVDGLRTDKMLRLSVLSPDQLVNRNIVAVGYPALDPRNDAALQDKIFGGVYYVKRLQPGVVRARAKVQSFENQVNAMTHDASTLGGNSGSAIIDVDSGEVVALHFAGEYLKANYAVPMFELARDSRVASKLNFDGRVAATSDFDPAWRSVGAEATPPPTRSIPTPPSTPLQSSQPSAAEESESTWIVPLRVIVSVGTPSRPTPIVRGVGAVADQMAAAGVEAEEAVVVNQDYSDRPGYDPNFLDTLKVPLPAISDAMQQDTATVRPDARKNGDPFELAYYHYSVYMNKRRRTAWFSAANVDGDHRPQIGKRQGDRWYQDTRILKTEQLGQDAFEHGIDRGHLTRREDTAWGDDVESATAANNDTFHFTNCCLQASPFNRGKDRWQGLEQFLLEQHAKKERRRMMVITGPLFSSNDPVHRDLVDRI
jgi:endonuclease G, mitochondrial